MSRPHDNGHPFLDLPRKWIVVGARDPHVKGYLFSIVIIKGMFPNRIVGLKFCHGLILCKRSVQSLQYSMRLSVHPLQFGHLLLLVEWCLGFCSTFATLYSITAAISCARPILFLVRP